MHKLYLFKIRESFQNDDLYDILNTVRKSSIEDISTTFSLYTSITNSISIKEKESICRHLKKNGNYQFYNGIHKFYDYYNNEKSFVKFHNNYILLKTNNLSSSIIEFIGNLKNYYLCDFYNKKGLHLNECNLVLE